MLAAAAGAALLAITALALWLRLSGLAGRDGTFTVDEARLALAGRGILEHGLPILPSGWLYTRGLLAAYPVALSFALLGLTDLAARLPSVLAGAALVPVMYALGRALGGRAGGLFAALFVAGHPALVVWSRAAWFYALYVLLFAAALLWIVRAHQHDRARDQLLAGALTGLTCFAHELGVFLFIPLLAQVTARLRACRGSGSGDCRRASLAGLALALGSLVLLWALVTRLRAGTLIGPYGELAEYFSPHLEGVPFRFYGRMLADGRWLLLVAALVGIPLALVQRRFVALLLWLALVPPFVHAVTIIPDRPQERYGLTLVVVLVPLAVFGAAEGASWAAERWRALAGRSGLLTSIVLLGILFVHQDIGQAVERSAFSPRDGAWLTQARGLEIGPADLVMSDLPTVAGWYVGDLDFWVSSREFEKYTLRAGDARRDVHTGAVLVRSVADFQRLVAAPHAGRTLWVYASGRSYQWGELVDDSLKAYLERAATRRVSPGDGSRILRIDL